VLFLGRAQKTGNAKQNPEEIRDFKKSRTTENQGRSPQQITNTPNHARNRKSRKNSTQFQLRKWNPARNRNTTYTPLTGMSWRSKFTGIRVSVKLSRICSTERWPKIAQKGREKHRKSLFGTDLELSFRKSKQKKN